MDDELAPTWGKDEVYYMIVELYLKQGKYEEAKLYLNKGNLKFEDISEKANISGDSRWYTGTTMVDVNNDGYLDIYCSVGGKFGPKENQLFINNKTMLCKTGFN